MLDSRLEKLADVLVNYSTAVKKGDWVIINANVFALPLVTEIVRHVYRAGGNPTVNLNAESLQEAFYLEANEEQLGWVAPFEEMMIEQADVSIAIRAAENTRTLTNIDSQRQAISRKARSHYFKKTMERAARGEFRWVVTQYPCPAYAQEADMSLREYADFVYKATFVDQPDPVQCWNDLYQEQQRLVDWLKGKKEVVVHGPHIELKLSIDGRTFINSDGKNNMPSGEIFTGPVEQSVNGWVQFTYPAIRDGREVEGVELRFEDGKVVQASAKKNQEYLLSCLDSDAGARYLGEFAIGTNYGIQRFTKSILYDEKIGGTLHMAVGAGYPETGSQNQSGIHWDFICDMRQDSEIYVDGELFYKNGQFQI